MDTKFILMISVIMVAALMAGCAMQPQVQQIATNSPPNPPVETNTESVNSSTGGNAQIANPASVYCKENGGTFQINETPEGQQGLCVLKDGKVCDEWQYYRGECPAGGAQAHKCTAQEKQQVACTMEYAPVCGNDGKTYGNKCSACAAGIDSWVLGECLK